MSFFVVGIALLNSLAGLIMYVLMHQKRKVLSDRYGMIMSMCISGILSLNIAMNIHFLFPGPLSVIMFITAAIGGMIGIAFGALVKFQSLLSGFSHGVTGAIMGTMLSAVIQDPSLCSLPSFYLNTMNDNIISFCLFGMFLVFMTCYLLYYSFRV